MAITAVVHVDDIFAGRQKERCDRSCVDLNRTIPVKNLGDLKWYGGCRYSRDPKRGTLTISQLSFAKELVKKFRATSVQSVPPKVGAKLDEFDEDDETESLPFREFVGGLMWMSISTRPDISNASSTFNLLLGTVPHRKPSTGNRRLVFSHTSMVTTCGFAYVPARDYNSYFFRGFCRRRLPQ